MCEGCPGKVIPHVSGAKPDIHCHDKQTHIPLCVECEGHLCQKRPSQPPLALTNDMWFGHMTRFIYENQVTVVELMAASVLSTSMLSYQLDYHGSRSLQGAAVHMSDARVVYGGNITSFMHPVEEVTQRCQELFEEEGKVRAKSSRLNLACVYECWIYGRGTHRSYRNKASHSQSYCSSSYKIRKEVSPSRPRLLAGESYTSSFVCKVC